jgi:hypothetical protein
MVGSKKECCGLKLSLDVDLVVEYMHVIPNPTLPFKDISSLPKGLIGRKFRFGQK